MEVSALKINPFDLIGKEWLLITAGNQKCNTMTASWGGLGVIWNKSVATIYVRPQRYTKKFIDEGEYFSLSFFDESYKAQLGYLGRVSGKDEDKIKKAALTVCQDTRAAYFEEAKMVLMCKKLYHSPILSEGFVDSNLDTKNYPEKDYHEMYIGEIVEVLIRE